MATAGYPSKSPAIPEVAEDNERRESSRIHKIDSTSPSRKRQRESSASGKIAIEKSHSPKRSRMLPVRGKDGEDGHFEQHTSFRVEMPIMDIATENSQAPKHAKSLVGQADGEASGVSQAAAEVERDESNNTHSSSVTRTRAPLTRGETPSKAGNQPDTDSEDSVDSADEAPEEVGAQDAAHKARTAAREAARAAGLQEETARKKRKEKSGRLQKQAEEASKRRESAKRKKQVEASPDTNEDASGVFGAGEVVDEVFEEQSNPMSRKLPKLDRSNLPDFLPLEYLSDTDDPHVLPLISSSSKTEQPRRPNKIKFLDEKKPKDVVRGRTVYRVAKKDRSAGLLAPKADKNARNLKEGWLAGRKGRLGENVRRKPASGFFVK